MQINHFVGVAALVFCSSSLSAQAAPPATTSRALATWIALDASPGDMERAARSVRAVDSSWIADAHGNLVLRRGTGRPRRVVACGLDHPGYAVSAITGEGYLRLHRAGNARVHDLWDQAHQAQQVVIYTAAGPLPGVVANPNGHFGWQHRGDTAVVDVDDLWVDIGAESRAEAERMGVDLMDRVYRDLPPWTYQGHVSGADASGRVGCAAVASAARRAPARGETIFVLSAQRSFRWSGLNAVLAELASVDSLVLVTPAAFGALGDRAGVRPRRIGTPRELSAAAIDSATQITPAARWAGTLVESVALDDADALLSEVASASGVSTGAVPWLALGPSSHGAVRPPTSPANAAAVAASAVHDSLAALLTLLADLPGAPGHEGRVREAIRSRLPAWARASTTVDAAGNLIVAAGPQRDTTVFIAHMDEVAYEVDGILPDGRVTLARRGGVIPSAWEGQPALLHFDAADGQRAPESLPGVFVPRDSASLRAPSRALTAWFGLDSAALVARGAAVGSAVTAYKRGVRLGPVRYTARGLDDRAGSLALLRAVQSIDPERLTNHVLFVWSTAEESGLVGASALARRIGASVKRVYAVDTFVSSDTPLELHTFAYAPLGHGPVLRALDDGIAASRATRERIARVAQGRGIPLQVGTTHGSTDATAFVAWGAEGAGLSWPGRYSHSPAELLDLRDLAHLVKLIEAVAAAGTPER